jgi:anti-sigma factor ChrR (cupin superfamily)
MLYNSGGSIRKESPMMAGNHTDEETLEGYSMGRLSESEAAPVEEHPLICEECMDRLERLDTYHRALQAALIQTDPRELGMAVSVGSIGHKNQ